jgi:hypothetical protein
LMVSEASLYTPVPLGCPQLNLAGVPPVDRDAEHKQKLPIN